MHWLQMLSLVCGISGVTMILVFLDSWLDQHPTIDRWLERFIDRIGG